jgi:hypothetical protein
VQEDGKLVAVLVGCAATWHAQARDETVGWDAVILLWFGMGTGQIGNVKPGHTSLKLAGRTQNEPGLLMERVGPWAF